MSIITATISADTLTDRIHIIHGHKVLLSNDLADLYMVEHRALMQAVKRNIDRFPDDFMFQLSEHDWNNLKSQVVISSWGGSRKTPFAFTEQGVAMLSSVLRSDHAVQVNIEIMRAFVRLRNVLSEHRELAARLDVLEQRYDENFKIVFDAIRQLMAPPDKKKRGIGFLADKE
jgi:ORF6N domain